MVDEKIEQPIEFLGFRRGLDCPLCGQWHPVQYVYKGKEIVACPQVEKDKIILMSLDYVRDEVNRMKGMQKL